MISIFLISAIPATPVFAANDRYWVGGPGYWTQTAHWSTSSGGASGASIPNSTNDVHFDANSGLGGGGMIQMSSTPICHDIDFTGIGVIYWQNSNYGLSVYGNFSGTTGLNIKGDLKLYGSGATWTNNGSKLQAEIITQAGSSYRVTDYMESGDIIDNRLGSILDTISDSSYIEMSGLPDPADYNTIFYPYSGGTYYEIRMTGSDSGLSSSDYRTHSITDDFTCTNLTFSNGQKNDVFYIYDDITVTGTLTFDGQAENNRGKIIGYDSTQRTLTAATVVCDHFDFSYIIGAGAGDWDLSSAGEDTIDYTNNTNITFTYPYDDDEDIYWTGLQDGIDGSGDWEDQYNWSNVSGGAGGMARHYLPTQENNVYFDANSGFTVGNNTVGMTGGSWYCKDMDFTGSGAIQGPDIYMTSNNYIYLYGDLTFETGMTITMIQSSYWYFMGAGNITTNGVPIDNGIHVYLQASGTYTLQDDLYIGDGTSIQNYWDYVSGTLDMNGNNMIFTNSGTGTITFNGGGHTYSGGVYFYDAANVYIFGENTFGTFYRQGGPYYTDNVQFGADQYITDLYWYGYNGYQRLQVKSTTSGVQRQISVSNSVNVVNCDISDIAGVGAASWDISAGNNSDFGGNLGIIFTTGIYIYWVGNSGSWSDATNHWSYSSGGSPGARVPLVQDIAVFDSSSFTIPDRTVTIDITNLSGIDAETVINNPTFSKSGTVDLYGDVLLGTVTWNVTSTYFKGLDTALSSASTLNTNMYVSKNANFMSSLFLGSSINVAGTVYVRSGTFDLNGWDMTCDHFYSEDTTSTRAIQMGSGVTTIDGTASGNKLYFQYTNLEFYCETSTIILSNSTTQAQSFRAQNQTFNNIEIAGAGDWTLTWYYPNTIYELLIDRSEESKTLSGNYLLTIEALTLEVSDTRTITITNTDFTMATGVVLGDYLILSGSSASGGASFFANVGGHSTDNGGNSGWIWTAPTAPTVVTHDATDVSNAGATINGELTSLGDYATFYVYFEYGPTIAYGYETDLQTLTELGAFDDRLSPFHPYHFRAVVEFGFNDHAYGDDKTITLSGAVPQAKAAVSDPGEDPGDVLVDSAPDPIPGMYDEGSTAGLLGIPEIIDPALNEADMDVEVFWYPIAFAIALILGFLAFGMTKSLLIQAIVSALTMAGFCGGGVLGTGLLPWMTVVIFALEAFLIWIIQQKQFV